MIVISLAIHKDGGNRCKMLGYIFEGNGIGFSIMGI